jgi:hypothetical protein
MGGRRGLTCGIYSFFYGKGNDNHKLSTEFLCVRQSYHKRVEFVVGYLIITLRGCSCHHCGGRNGLYLWRVAANRLTMQPRTNDKVWYSSLGVGRGAQPFTVKNVTKNRTCKQPRQPIRQEGPSGWWFHHPQRVWATPGDARYCEITTDVRKRGISRQWR